MHHLVFLLVALVAPPLAAGDPFDQLCGNTGNYTANSTYQANLLHLSKTLPTNASKSPKLFATASTGTVPDRVYALALCRGDDNSSSCFACVTNAFSDAQNLCAYTKDATIYYDPCLLRYSNEQFLTSTANSDEIYGWNLNNVTSQAGRFNLLVLKLMNATADFAASNSSRKFATGVADFDKDFPKVYGLAQCTPDLSPVQCRSCLADQISHVPLWFGGRQGGRILAVRCNLRYEVYPFYSGAAMVKLPASAVPPAPAPAPSAVPVVTPSTRGGGGKNVTGIVLAIALPTVAVLLAITLICFYFRRKRRSPRKAAVPYTADPEEISSVESLLLDLSTLRLATSDFDESNKLGEGGFGAVYKGVLPDGQEIAVKRLSQSSGQGLGELKNELVLVAKLQHRNLVRLLGICMEEQEKLLVYEFVPNRSLDTILFDPEKAGELDWWKRYKIINGVARGLQYLHEDSQLKIIHRDLKASNILLDADMNPKISDFGLARLFGGDQTQDVTNRVVGTFGYMAPEYAMRGNYSVKSDIFSFGVLVLETVTGRRNSGSYNSEQSEDLFTLIWEHWNMGTITEVIDPSLGSNWPRSEILRCIHIGLLCLQEKPVDRPLMSAIVVMLSGNTVSLQAPSRPAYCIRNSGTDSKIYSDVYGGTRTRSSSKSIPMSVNDVSITELEPR